MKTLLFIALPFYLVGFVPLVALLFKKQVPPIATILMPVFCGFALHTGSIVLRGLEVDRFPLVLSVEIFSFLGWVIAGYFLIGSLSNRSRLLVNYIFPIAFVSTLIAAFLPAPPLTPARVENFGDTLLFPIHTSMIIFAYAAFIVTFLAGIMYIIQERELKLKRFGSSFFKLPALDTCDDLGYKAMSAGFVMLTLGMVAGIVWSGRHFGVYFHGDPIEILSLLTWFTYLFIIHYRVTAGWRGRRAAIVAIIGFVFVLFSLVGFKYLGGFHVFQG